MMCACTSNPCSCGERTYIITKARLEELRRYHTGWTQAKNVSGGQYAASCTILELLDEIDRHAERIENLEWVLKSIERRAGSASMQSGYTDAIEVAEWAREALKP